MEIMKIPVQNAGWGSMPPSCPAGIPSSEGGRKTEANSINLYSLRNNEKKKNYL